ncbi:hypothetical protein I4F81_002340 [Pyropia yezoensis]|uniref:Uncharacterized protein n=1 Tax=Pyropia yezoensis TaxID=2788 RepID=A0ACC3BQS7_PYRYE|nr:hypothetical protein I4F81_002340 [Neopyropia yezoensis]
MVCRGPLLCSLRVAARLPTRPASAERMPRACATVRRRHPLRMFTPSAPPVAPSDGTPLTALSTMPVTRERDPEERERGNERAKVRRLERKAAAALARRPTTTVAVTTPPRTATRHYVPVSGWQPARPGLWPLPPAALWPPPPRLSPALALRWRRRSGRQRRRRRRQQRSPRGGSWHTGGGTEGEHGR